MMREEELYRTQRADAERSAAEHLSLSFSGQATEQDLAAAEEWRSADPEHELAWVRLQAIWDASLTVADDPRLQAMRTQARSARPAMLRFNQWANFNWQKVAVAASLTLAVGLSSYIATTNFGSGGMGTDIAWSQPHEAPQLQSMQLADGSAVTMNKGASVRTSITADGRLVDLQKGAAYFDVAHHQDNRFTVSAGDVSVTALGTSFAVERANDVVTITLVEGSVQVKSAGGTLASGERILKPGEQLVISSQSFKTAAVDADKSTQWARAMQEFHAVPLSQVVGVVNRFSDSQIRLQDSALGSQSFSGLIPVSNADHLVSLLTEQGVARVVDRKDGVTTLAAAR